MKGLIPAHAGKTIRHLVIHGHQRAHPRSRGENSCHWETFVSPLGSSPLTRGKHHGRARRDLRRGLLPAHAGKTASLSASPTTRRAHPRSRGENTYADEDRNLALGSSPLTRGKHRIMEINITLDGLIPAHAGKTPWWHPYGRAHRAHPRSRGENVTPGGSARATSGSSPLTRGKHIGDNRVAEAWRLIPAHAGKTGAGSVG